MLAQPNKAPSPVGITDAPTNKSASRTRMDLYRTVPNAIGGQRNSSGAVTVKTNEKYDAMRPAASMSMLDEEQMALHHANRQSPRAHWVHPQPIQAQVGDDGAGTSVSMTREPRDGTAQPRPRKSHSTTSLPTVPHGGYGHASRDLSWDDIDDPARGGTSFAPRSVSAKAGTSASAAAAASRHRKTPDIGEPLNVHVRSGNSPSGHAIPAEPVRYGRSPPVSPTTVLPAPAAGLSASFDAVRERSSLEQLATLEKLLEATHLRSQDKHGPLSPSGATQAQGIPPGTRVSASAEDFSHTLRSANAGMRSSYSPTSSARLGASLGNSRQAAAAMAHGGGVVSTSGRRRHSSDQEGRAHPGLPISRKSLSERDQAFLGLSAGFQSASTSSLRKSRDEGDEEMVRLLVLNSQLRASNHMSRRSPQIERAAEPLPGYSSTTSREMAFDSRTSPAIAMGHRRRPSSEAPPEAPFLSTSPNRNGTYQFRAVPPPNVSNFIPPLNMERARRAAPVMDQPPVGPSAPDSNSPLQSPRTGGSILSPRSAFTSASRRSSSTSTVSSIQPSPRG